jgi:hypothetical protein
MRYWRSLTAEGLLCGSSGSSAKKKKKTKTKRPGKPPGLFLRLFKKGVLRCIELVILPFLGHEGVMAS